MTAPDLLANVLLGSLWLYLLTGGADFGGGFWDLVASGPRRQAQRHLIDRAIAPIWEANHVWLILALVILFTGFPSAFARLAVALHWPLTLLLLGIVLRGAAFVFRHYGPTEGKGRWGRLFAVTSTMSPFFLGVILGAVSTPTPDEWLTPFTLLVGAFSLALVSFLAAVYLTVEATDSKLQGDFRRRALAAQGALVSFAVGAAGMGRPPQLGIGLMTALVALVATVCLGKRNYRGARVAAVAQVSGVLLGWGWSQYPYLAPPLTIHAASAPIATLKWLLAALGVGSFVLFPSLLWLMKVFKSER